LFAARAISNPTLMDKSLGYGMTLEKSKLDNTIFSEYPGVFEDPKGLPPR
jgi:hypothetical protein